MEKLFVPVFLAAAVASVAGQAQQSNPQAPDQGPTFRTGVEVIAVDVGVVDRRGRPVTDLLAPDFEVKIDGAPRRVVSAEYVHIDVEAARREAADPVEPLYTSNLKPPNGRLIVIAFDQAGVRSGYGRPILNTAAKFLDQLSPADRVAFVAYPPPGCDGRFHERPPGLEARDGAGRRTPAALRRQVQPRPVRSDRHQRPPGQRRPRTGAPPRMPAPQGLRARSMREPGPARNRPHRRGHPEGRVRFAAWPPRPAAGIGNR